jgi:hypothetical protein
MHPLTYLLAWALVGPALAVLLAPSRAMLEDFRDKLIPGMGMG